MCISLPQMQSMWDFLSSEEKCICCSACRASVPLDIISCGLLQENRLCCFYYYCKQLHEPYSSLFSRVSKKCFYTKMANTKSFRVRIPENSGIIYSPSCHYKPITPCLHRSQQFDSNSSSLSTLDATKWPLQIIWTLCQYVINRTRHQFTVLDLSRVNTIADHNGFYCILSCRAVRVRCRHSVRLWLIFETQIKVFLLKPERLLSLHCKSR